jgi:hypothetical protein
MRTAGVRPGGSTRAAAVALAAGAVALATVALAPAVAARPGLALQPADGGCGAGNVGGVVHCSDVLNNSLNGISIHILGH